MRIEVEIEQLSLLEHAAGFGSCHIDGKAEVSFDRSGEWYLRDFTVETYNPTTRAYGRASVREEDPKFFALIASAIERDGHARAYVDSCVAGELSERGFSTFGYSDAAQHSLSIGQLGLTARGL